jgi:hypothetical protein
LPFLCSFSILLDLSFQAVAPLSMYPSFDSKIPHLYFYPNSSIISVSTFIDASLLSLTIPGGRVGPKVGLYLLAPLSLLLVLSPVLSCSSSVIICLRWNLHFLSKICCSCGEHSQSAHENECYCYLSEPVVDTYRGKENRYMCEHNSKPAVATSHK